MSKIAIILCVALFASAANASYVGDQLAKAQESLKSLIEGSIAQVKSTIEATKQKSVELTNEIQNKADEYKKNVSDDVEKRLKTAVDGVVNLTRAVPDADVSECSELADHLRYTAQTALLQMKRCFVDKRTTAAGYIENMIKFADGVLADLNVHKLEARACLDNVDGILSASRALLCTNVVAAKAAWTTSKAVPLISIEAMKLSFLLTTLPPTLTYCTTISAISAFYYESSVILGRTSQCIRQKLEEVRDAAPGGLPDFSESSVTTEQPSGSWDPDTSDPNPWDAPELNIA